MTVITEKVNNEKKEHEDLAELLDGINYTGDKGPCFGMRHGQIVLMAIGIGIALATKMNFSIIVIAMTTENTTLNSNITVFDWNNKGVVVGAILWSGIPVQIAAGYLGKLWGYKWLTLGCSIVNAVFFILIPMCAGLWGAAGVIFCRVVQGAALGGLGPLTAVLNGVWIPAEERSKAGMVAVAGPVLILILSSVLSGIIAASYIGWPWCFYIFGAAELVWCAFWLFLAHESPQSHPTISQEEKKYIEVSLGQHKAQNIPTPWKKILSSIHFWAIIVATLGTDWTATMLTTEIPIFMAKVLAMDVQTSGTILAIAPLVGMAFGLVIAPVSDLIVKRKIVRCVNARRLFHTIGSVGNGITIVLMTLLPPGSTIMITLSLCLANIFIIMYSVGGSTVNALDVSPVFAGIICGVSNTFSQAFALFAPLSVDWIVQDEGSAAEWRTIFTITAGIAIATTTFFDIFATGKRQEEWEVLSSDNHEEKKERIV